MVSDVCRHPQLTLGVSDIALLQSETLPTKDARTLAKQKKKASLENESDLCYAQQRIKNLVSEQV